MFWEPPLTLAALLLAFRKWRGYDAIRVEMESHGREEISTNLDLSQTVGWFTSTWPLTLAVEESAPLDDLDKLIKGVKEQVRAVPQKGLGFGILCHLNHDKDIKSAITQQPVQVVFNYLGQFDQTLNAKAAFLGSNEFHGKNLCPSQERTHLLGFNGHVLE